MSSEKAMSRDYILQILIMCAYILQYSECTNVNTLKMSDEMHKIISLLCIIEFLTLEGVQTIDIYDRAARVYGESAPSYATVKRWAGEFRKGRQSLEGENRSGRPVDTVLNRNIKVVEDCMMANWRVSVRQIALTIRISETSVKHILHECLDMTKVCVQWVLRMLTDEMRQNWRAISADNLRLMEDNEKEFYKRIVTGDKMWLHLYDSDNKRDSMH